MDGELLKELQQRRGAGKVVEWGSSPVQPPHIFLQEGYNSPKPTIKVRRVFGASSVIVANSYFIFPSVSLQLRPLTGFLYKILDLSKFQQDLKAFNPKHC